jgi:MFS family permease
MTVTAPGARTASAATVKETVSEAPVGVAVDAGVAYGAEPIDLGSPSRETPENIEGSEQIGFAVATHATKRSHSAGSELNAAKAIGEMAPPTGNAPSRCEIWKYLPSGANGSYLRLVGGSSLSMLGTRMSSIAYPMLVLLLTKSPIMAGWAAFAATAPSILAYIPAGALVDRWNARIAMLVSEIGRGCAILTVVLAFWLGHSAGWVVSVLIAMAVLEETLEVFSGLSERRLITGLLGRADASSSSGGNEARTHVVVMVGRPAGGLLFGLAPVLPFVADAFSFLFSIGSLVTVKYRKSSDAVQRSPRDPEYSAKKILEGLRWVWHDRFARAACLLNAGGTLVVQALILIFLFEADRVKFTYETVGIVLASTGAGGVLGSLVAKRLMRWFSEKPLLRWFSGRWFRFQMCLWLIVFIGISVTINTHHLLRFLVVEMFVIGLTGAIGNVEIDRYLIERSPDEMLGRVASVSSLMDFFAYAVGPVLGGWLVQIAKPDLAILVLAMVVLALAVWSVWMPSAQPDNSSGQIERTAEWAEA